MKYHDNQIMEIVDEITLQFKEEMINASSRFRWLAYTSDLERRIKIILFHSYAMYRANGKIMLSEIHKEVVDKHNISIHYFTDALNKIAVVETHYINSLRKINNKPALESILERMDIMMVEKYGGKQIHYKIHSTGEIIKAINSELTSYGLVVISEDNDNTETKPNDVVIRENEYKLLCQMLCYSYIHTIDRKTLILRKLYSYMRSKPNLAYHNGKLISDTFCISTLSKLSKLYFGNYTTPVSEIILYMCNKIHTRLHSD